MDLNLFQVEDRCKICEIPELGQAPSLQLVGGVLLQEQEQVAEELPAVERDLCVLLQPLRPLWPVVGHVLGQHLRWLADSDGLVGRLGKLLDDLCLRFLK